MDILKKAEQFLFKTSNIILFACFFLFYLMKFGLGFEYPDEIFAQNPFIFPDTMTALNAPIFYSWLSAFLGYCIGAKTYFTYSALQCLFLFCFHMMTIKILWNTHNKSPENIRKSIIIFFCFSVAATPFYFVRDALILCLFSLSVLMRKNRAAVFVFGILSGMQHFELAIISASLLFFYDHFCHKAYSTQVILFIIGTVLGRLILEQIFSYNEIIVPNKQAYFFKNLQMITLFDLKYFQVIIYSVFSVGWIFIIKYFEQCQNKKIFLLYLLATIGISFLGIDHTRIAAIGSFFLVMYCILLNGKFIQSCSKQLISSVFLIWLLIPWFWVFVGQIRTSHFPGSLFKIWQISYALPSF